MHSNIEQHAHLNSLASYAHGGQASIALLYSKGDVASAGAATEARQAKLG